MVILDNIIRSLQMRIHDIQKSHLKPTYSSKGITAPLSIEYSSMKMTKECKYAKVFYSRINVITFQKLLNVYKNYVTDGNLRFEKVIDRLGEYVNGWRECKVITSDNIEFLNEMIASRKAGIQKYTDQFDVLMTEFQKTNADTDDMLDSMVVPLYQHTKIFFYRKAYYQLFSKDRINTTKLADHVHENMEYLNQFSDMLALLYTGWDKVGKGEAFDQYRHVQMDLILSIQAMTTVIEMDVALNERFNSLTETILNFKVYPEI